MSHSKRRNEYPVYNEAKRFKPNVYKFDRRHYRNDPPEERRHSPCDRNYYNFCNTEFDTEFSRIISTIEEPPQITRQKCEAIIKHLETEMRRAGIEFTYAAPFGSSVTALAMKDSDIDIFVHFQREDRRLLARIKNQLHKSAVFNNLNFIGRAKVPIIKCNYRPTNTQCDISASSPSGCMNTKLIQFYFNMDPNIRRMVLFLKHWLKMHLLHGTGKIVTYALNWLVIFYLQTLNLLPAVKYLQDLTPIRHMIKLWDYSFADDNRGLLHGYISDFRSVLHGFFQFYANFNYEYDIISPYVGRIISAREFCSLDTVPAEFRRYKDLLAKNVIKPLNLRHCCYVQDPFEHNNNVVFQAAFGVIREFIIGCARAARLLESSDSSKVILRKILSSQGETILKNTLPNLPKILVDMKMSKFNLTSNKDDFIAVFRAFCYVCTHVYKLQIDYDDEDICRNLNNADFPQYEAVLKCKTNVDVCTDRKRFKKKNKKITGSLIERFVEISNKCAIPLDHDFHITIIFTARPSTKSISLSLGGPMVLTSFMQMSCVYLIAAYLKKFGQHENFNAAENATVAGSHYDDDNFQIPAQLDNNNSSSDNVVLDESDLHDIQIIENSGKHDVENTVTTANNKNDSIQLIDIGNSDTDAENVDNSNDIQIIDSDAKNNNYCSDDDNDIQIIDVISRKPKIKDDMNDDDIQVVDMILNIAKH